VARRGNAEMCREHAAAAARACEHRHATAARSTVTTAHGRRRRKATATERNIEGTTPGGCSLWVLWACGEGAPLVDDRNTVEKKKTPTATASWRARTSSLSVILRRSGLAEGDQGLPGAGPGERTRLGTGKISRRTSFAACCHDTQEALRGPTPGPAAFEHHRISSSRVRPPLMERLQALLCTRYLHSVSSNLWQGGGAWSTSPATSRTSPDFASLAILRVSAPWEGSPLRRWSWPDRVLPAPPVAGRVGFTPRPHIFLLGGLPRSCPMLAMASHLGYRSNPRQRNSQKSMVFPTRLR
jgi:hypothetical protein